VVWDEWSGSERVLQVILLSRHLGGVVLCCYERTLAVACMLSVLIPMTTS